MTMVMRFPNLKHVNRRKAKLLMSPKQNHKKFQKKSKILLISLVVHNRRRLNHRVSHLILSTVQLSPSKSQLLSIYSDSAHRPKYSNSRRHRRSLTFLQLVPQLNRSLASRSPRNHNLNCSHNLNKLYRQRNRQQAEHRRFHS